MSTTAPLSFDAVTVTLNPAIDRTVSISGFKPGAVNRVESVCNTAGGKGVNVAASLADAGSNVAVTGFLGRENATIFERLFASKKITDRFVRIEGETRIGIKITDPEDSSTTDINFPGIAPEPGDIQTLCIKMEALKAPWFVLGGSVPPEVRPSIYRDIISFLKELGRKVLVDTSDEPLRLALEAAPTIIKPNIHELEALLGISLPDEAAVIKAGRTLVESGIEMVVVSMGKKGACFVTKDDAVVARPPDIEVRSTVGAGDAMVAGIISAQLQGLPLDACAELGTAFSVQALTRQLKPCADFSAAVANTRRQIRLS